MKKVLEFGRPLHSVNSADLLQKNHFPCGRDRARGFLARSRRWERERSEPESPRGERLERRAGNRWETANFVSPFFVSLVYVSVD